MIDNLTEAGARILVKRIEEYWSEHGRAVECRVEKYMMGRGENKLSVIFVVRSDLGMNIPTRVKVAAE